MRAVCGSKALYKFQIFEESQYISPDKKQLTKKISKKRRIAIASAVGLDNLSSNLQIIILRSSLSSITSLLSHHLPYIQINALIGRAEGLHFLINKTFKSIC